MILSVPKCIFLAVCIYVATADNIDPPSCSQIANNPMKCIWHRFKVQCAKECDPNNQNNQNNGNNGSPNNQNNGNNGNNAGGNSVTRVTTKPVTGHQGSSEEKSDSKGNKEQWKLGKNKTRKPKSGESTVGVYSQDSTVSGVTNKPISTGMTNSHTGIRHSHETGATNKPISTGNTNSPSGNHHSHEDQNRQVVPAVHHSNEDHNDGDSNEDHTSNKPSTRKFSTKRPSTPSTKSKSNKNCNKVDPCVDLAKANEGFKQRCQAAGIKDTCWEKCKYDVTFDELKKAMLGKQCPIDGMRTYLQCGANSQDNRACCEKTGVLEGKRAFCYPFCNPNGAEWPAQNQAMKYMPCAGQLNAIMRCHWAGLND